ncbi:MAG TPA: hypothetical protein VGO03_15885 [Acidimicrobiia bacterium]|jgi:hypothetical protein
MRKTILTVASVAALAMPLFALAPTTAGAAAATPTCKTASGSGTFTPALPPLSQPNTKVKSTVTSTGTEKGCTGGGVTSATLTGKFKFSTAGNCTTLLQGTGGTISGPATLKWNTGKTSTVGAAKLGQVKGQATEATITGKITAGLFVGKSVAQTITFAVTSGECTSKPLSKVTYTQKTSLTIK